MRFSSAFAAAAVVAVTAGVLTGCSSSGGSDGPVTLDYWAWAPGSAEEVKNFNASHPDIQVKLTDAGGGDPSSAKLLTASRAGNAPDVASIENTVAAPPGRRRTCPSTSPSYVADVKDKFSRGSWAQTTFSGKTFGVPQDIGPMALLYRQDVFDKYGVAAPTTWDDYEQAAATDQGRRPRPDHGLAQHGRLGLVRRRRRTGRRRLVVGHRRRHLDGRHRRPGTRGR